VTVSRAVTPGTPGVPFWRVVPLAVALSVNAAPSIAQEVTGVALDPAGQPMVDVPVVLHRVGGGGGAMAGVDTTDADGGFRFTMAAGDSAVYFAAVRHEGRLFVGPAIQAGQEAVTGYVLQVGPASDVGSVGAALSGAAPPVTPARPAARQGGGDTGALWLVSLLALTAAVTFVLTAPRYRERRTRDAVIEVARIENRLAGASDELSPEDLQRLKERRDRLKEQLAPRA
jgi:hypothetical protein